MNTTHQHALPSYEDMVKAGMHLGRKKTIFHPNMKPFVYTTKENIYILDLVKTEEGLVKALDFLKECLTQGKVVLFVGLTKQSATPIKEVAEALKMPYVINRWLGGTLTNFKTIIARVKHLEDLEREQRENGFEKYTKKEKIMKEREIATLRIKFDGLRSLTKIPDVLFLSSLKESQLPVHEAKLMGVKTVSIVNTDSNPAEVQYAIPANDTSKRSIEVILNTIKAALQS